MANGREMPSNAGNNPRERGAKKAVSAAEFWETELKRPLKGGRDDESFGEAMDRSVKQTEATKKIRIESIREITDGIKRRLGDWDRGDLAILHRHLNGMNSQNLTFDESFDEMLAKCAEGTYEGRIRKDKDGNQISKISRNPNVAPQELIDKLPWVVGHDDAKLGVQAGKIISVGELKDLVNEVLKG